MLFGLALILALPLVGLGVLLVHLPRPPLTARQRAAIKERDGIWGKRHWVELEWYAHMTCCKRCGKAFYLDDGTFERQIMTYDCPGEPLRPVYHDFTFVGDPVTHRLLVGFK